MINWDDGDPPPFSVSLITGRYLPSMYSSITYLTFSDLDFFNSLKVFVSDIFFSFDDGLLDEL